MQKNDVDYITPENILLKKAGTGGLSEEIIARAQAMADAITIDVKPFAVNKIDTMKSQLETQDFITAQNDNWIEDFLYDLMPLDVTLKLSENKAISEVSSHLLKFTERLKSLNVDAQHVIRAHINTLDILIKKNVENINDIIFKKLMDELQDACNRYNAKYS